MKEETTDSILKEALPSESIPKIIHVELEHLQAKTSMIALACSGGADSVFLVRWFFHVFPQWRERTLLLHFNHKTRGKDSEEDADFVKKLGEQWGLACHIGNHPDPDHTPPIALDEASLRQARLQFFKSAWQTENIGLLLTAHHAEDRVESLLMRLSRASALDGLVAPKAFHCFHEGMRFARPMLQLTKSRILNTLEQIGQEWREDASNGNDNYYRNFIRHQLLPIWKRRQPQSLIQNITQSLAYIEEDAEVLNNLAASAVHSCNLSDMCFPIQQFSQQPAPIQRRCLWMWFEANHATAGLSHEQVERVRRLEFGQRITLSEIWSVQRISSEHLQLQSRTVSEAFYPQEFHMDSSARVCFPDGKTLRSEQITLTSDLYHQICNGSDDPAKQVHLDLKALGAHTHLKIRFWQEGMRYAPFGLHHTRKIKSCFIDRKIECNLRRRLPVICNSEGEILWIPGLLPSEAGRVTRHSIDLLRLTYDYS